MKILIAGLSKTGTTGVLYLVANSMRHEPRIIFEPNVCPPDVQDEAGNLIAKVLVGTRLKAETFAQFDKKVTLVRDPRDRFISRLLYSQFSAGYLVDVERAREVQRCLIEKERNPSQVSVRSILEVMGNANAKRDGVADFVAGTEISHGVFDSYLRNFHNGLLYRYEDFVSARYSELEDYLGFALTGDARVPDDFGRVTRTQASGDWRNWFTEEDVRIFRPVLAPLLERYGYDPDDWALNAVPAIRCEHCSGYFQRLVDERCRKAAQ